MCLGIPGQVIELGTGEVGAHRRATVNTVGVERVVDTSLLDDLAVGDWVVVHLGFALSKLDPEEAQATLRMLDVETP